MTFLNGIRVLDFTQWLPGPFCTMLLADLGAEIIKVERPQSGDPSRTMIPGVFWTANRNKKSLSLDLKAPAADDVCRKLVQECDVLVEGFRPGVMARLGLDYETVSKINPSIIYCSISGYGQSGPYRDRPGHDINYLATSGALDVPGEYGQDPLRPGIPISDLSASMFGALTIVAAIYRRRESGTGDYLDVSITDCLASWVSTRIGDYLKESFAQGISYHHLSPTNRQYQTKDGQWLAVGLIEEKFWVDFCDVVNRNEWLDDPRYSSAESRRRHYEALYGELSELFRQRDLSDWERLFHGTDLPCSRLNRVTDLPKDPHMVHRGLLASVSDQGVQVQYPVHPRQHEIISPALPPQLGEHNSEILQWLGFTDERIEAYRHAGAI